MPRPIQWCKPLLAETVFSCLWHRPHRPSARLGTKVRNWLAPKITSFKRLFYQKIIGFSDYFPKNNGFNPIILRKITN